MLNIPGCGPLTIGIKNHQQTIQTIKIQSKIHHSKIIKLTNPYKNDLHRERQM